MIRNVFLSVLILICFTQLNVFAKTRIKKVICKPIFTVETGIYQGFQGVKCDKLYGIKNSFSRVTVNPKYTKLENLDDNFVKVRLGKSYGLIDFSGKVVIAPKYKDVQVARIKLADDEYTYIYLAKTKKNWVTINGLEEKSIIKNSEKTSVLETDLQLIPHKLKISNTTYYVQIGTIKMGELLSGTPVSVMIPDKMPKWTLNQISTTGLMSLFLEKK